MSRILKLGGAALNQVPMDWDNNIRNIKQAIKLGIKKNVDILCLPELCITGYGCEDIYLSDWLADKAVSLLPEIVGYCENITVAIGLPVRLEGQLYSCACLIQNQRILGIVAKQNLANNGVHYEPRWFTAWTPGKVSTLNVAGTEYPFGDIIHIIKGVKVGFEICEDAWKKEKRPGYALRSKGVELLINPSASHFSFGKMKIRENIVIGGSEKLKCVYLYANLLGNEAGRMVYDGEIFIAQNGRLVQRNTRLSFQDINLVTADIDFDKPQNSDADLNPDTRNKNIEFAKAGALALFDYMRKSRSRGFVLSLSGGADSSTCAVLVGEMVKRGLEELGKEAFLDKIGYSHLLENISNLGNKDSAMEIMGHILTCAYQGTKNSSDDTFNSAKELAESIGATFHQWTIDEEVGSYTGKIEKALKRPLSWSTDDIALQNIQARARSPIIWMLANIKNALLLTTSNRSEGDVGYATMDGDTSGSIAPIAAVDKHFITNWLKWAEEELDYPALRHVNNLSPSAELRPLENKQTDEDDLMPYAIMVEIEKLAIKKHKSPIETFLALKEKNLEPVPLLKQHIIKFHRLWCRNQWKRERIAPAFHLDDFNVDPRTWCRFPILSSSFAEELKALESL